MSNIYGGCGVDTLATGASRYHIETHRSADVSLLAEFVGSAFHHGGPPKESQRTMALLPANQLTRCLRVTSRWHDNQSVAISRMSVYTHSGSLFVGLESAQHMCLNAPG